MVRLYKSLKRMATEVKTVQDTANVYIKRIINDISLVINTYELVRIYIIGGS
jgi:hypothetical protein